MSYNRNNSNPKPWRLGRRTSEGRLFRFRLALLLMFGGGYRRRGTGFQKKMIKDLGPSLWTKTYSSEKKGGGEVMT